MKFEKRPAPPRAETTVGPYVAAVRIVDGDAVYGPGDSVPDKTVERNPWLIDAGRVRGRPKPKTVAKKAGKK